MKWVENRTAGFINGGFDSKWSRVSIFCFVYEKNPNIYMKCMFIIDFIL